MNLQEYKEKVFAERPDVKREYEKLGEPLSLEELRRMDGKPVFLVFNFELEPMISLIEYVQVTDCIILTNNLGGRSEFCSDEELREYGIKAYAYPPVATDTDVGGKLDEWTAEWIKNDGYTECSKCEHWYDSPENEGDGDRPAFCPSCGRAMIHLRADLVEAAYMARAAMKSPDENKSAEMEKVLKTVEAMAVRRGLVREE